MRKLIIFLLILVPFLAVGQHIGTRGVRYDVGVPAVPPSMYGSWWSMDSATMIVRNYNWGTLTWDVSGIYNDSLYLVGDTLRIRDGYSVQEVVLPIADSSLFVTLSHLQDSTAAIRADFPDGADSSVFVTLTHLQDTAAAIRGDFPVDTDNQTVDTFSLSGTTLTLALEDDGESPYTVDIASILSGYVTGSGTSNELPYWATSSSLGSLTTATYPSLLELSYIKGLTSLAQTQLNAKHGGSLTSGYVPYSSAGGYGLADSGVQYDNATGAVTFPSASTGGAIMRDWTAASSYFAIYPKSVTPGTGNYSFLTNSTSVYLNAPGAGGVAVIGVQGTAKITAAASTIGLNSAGTGNTSVTIKGIGSTSSTTALLVENSVGTDALEVKDDGQILIQGTITAGLGGGAVSTNSAFGSGAMTATATGANNNAIGRNALKNLTSGGANNAQGVSALESLTTGTDNTAIGSNSLFALVSGGSNVAVGGDAMRFVTTSNNTAVGYLAGRYHTSTTNNPNPSNSIFIGWSAKSKTSGQSNETVIGFDAIGVGSNTATIGNSSVDRLSLGGEVSWFKGTGSPEGVVTANVGSFYSRKDGGSGTTFYVKESGTGNTGWVAK